MLIFYIEERCQYKGTKDKVLVDEGKAVGYQLRISSQECAIFCAATATCNSFAYCHNSECFLKDKILSKTEPYRDNKGCTTYFQTCKSGKHSEIV